MIRFDRSLSLDLASPRTAADGSLVVEGRAARVHLPGDALRYDSGHEHRDSGELDRIVAQLKGRPVLVDHPAIDFAKSGQRADGWISAARREGDHAIALMRIDSARAIRAIKDRTHTELSLGYECEVIDGWQRSIRVDHLALVPAARCGSSCSIRLDYSACVGSCGCAKRDHESLDVTARRRRELGRMPLPSDRVGQARAAERAAGLKPWQQSLPSTVMFKEPK